MFILNYFISQFMLLCIRIGWVEVVSAGGGQGVRVCDRKERMRGLENMKTKVSSTEGAATYGYSVCPHFTLPYHLLGGSQDRLIILFLHPHIVS